MKSVLITGTDTGVGKTVVCRLLAAYIRGCGLNVITQKWVQTGCSLSDDIDLHSVNLPVADDLTDLRVPYSFAYPASPHLAASLEGVEIDIARIVATHAKLTEQYEIVVVEGSGGVLVPITETALLADVAARLNLPIVIVADNKLGCINHTLLTIEAARSRSLRIVGLIFNRIESGGDEVILTDNVRITDRLGGVPVLGELPCLAESQDASELFQPIGEAFCREWSRIINE
jgi:dethiobiotin synthetase